MSFTAKEVEEKISEFEEAGYESTYGGGVYYDLKGEQEDIEVTGFGTLKFVDEYGGEGSGDEFWVVFKVGDQFFRKEGWYASYDGGELDGELYEVKAAKVQRTEYERI